MAAIAAKLASRLGPTLAKHASTIESVAETALGSVTEPEMEEPMVEYAEPLQTYPTYPSIGTPWSTYFLFADIIFLLIGVILLVAANGKCASDPDGKDCKNHRNWGIAFTVIFSVGLIVILFFKLQSG